MSGLAACWWIGLWLAVLPSEDAMVVAQSEEVLFPSLSLPLPWPARVREGLQGPVATVATESAGWRQRGGKWVEDARKPEAKMSFDAEGRYLEVTAYLDGSLLVQDRFEYDRLGRPVRNASFYAKGAVSGVNVYRYGSSSGDLTQYTPEGQVTCRFHLAFDDQGRLKEVMRMRGRDPDPWYTWVFTYDRERRPVERLTFDQRGSLRQKLSLGYGPHGETERVMRAPDGAVLYRLHLTYDRNARVEESRRYDGGGRLDRLIKSSYEADEKGNWVKRIDWRVQKDRKGMREDPIGTVYRTLVYGDHPK